MPSACVRTPRDDDDLRRDHLASTITFKSGMPHRTTLQQHSQLDGGIIVRLRATCCLTCCAGLLFAGAWCTVQSGRIARSAPEFAGTQLDKLYGIRCPRPPTLALPERSCSRTDCSCPLLTQALDRQTPRRPAPRPQSSLASAIPTDAAETAAATPHRVALHGIQASVAWAVTCVLVHRAAYGSRLGWRRTHGRRCGTLSMSHTPACAGLPCSALTVRAIRRVRCVCTCNTSDFEFSISPPPSSRAVYVCTF